MEWNELSLIPVIVCLSSLLILISNEFRRHSAVGFGFASVANLEDIVPLFSVMASVRAVDGVSVFSWVRILKYDIYLLELSVFNRSSHS